MGDFKLFKTLLVAAALAAGGWAAIQWLQDNPGQPSIEQITPPAVNMNVPQENPFEGG